MSARREVTAKIRELVAPIVSEAGLFLEDTQFKRAGKYSTLIVTVDLASGPGEVNSQDLEDISRQISAALDAADPIAGAYTLEVSTPGAERELVEERHYSRVEGRMANILLTDGTALQARVCEYRAGEGISVTTYGYKNKQRVETGERELTFGEIARARIVVEL